MGKWEILYLRTRYRSKLGWFFWFGPIHVTICRNLVNDFKVYSYLFIQKAKRTNWANTLFPQSGFLLLFVSAGGNLSLWRRRCRGIWRRLRFRRRSQHWRFTWYDNIHLQYRGYRILWLSACDTFVCMFHQLPTLCFELEQIWDHIYNIIVY